MRPLWSGTISFGLVNVGVRLFSAVQEKGIHFHILSGDGKCRLRQKLYCPETGKEYDFAETAKGFEIAPGQYVLLNKDEIEAIQPEKDGSFEIEHFIDLHEVDPLLFRGSYYLTADEGAERAFALLKGALAESERVAVGSFVMRDKEYLACIRPFGEILVLETMYFEEDIRKLDELPHSAKKPVVKKAESDLAVKLVNAGTMKFNHAKYKSTYREKMTKLIAKKASGKSITKEVGERKQRSSNVVDLTAALEKSLKNKGGNKLSAKSSTKLAPKKKAAQGRR